jgi:hypothetical protein
MVEIDIGIDSARWLPDLQAKLHRLGPIDREGTQTAFWGQAAVTEVTSRPKENPYGTTFDVRAGRTARRHDSAATIRADKNKVPSPNGAPHPIPEIREEHSIPRIEFAGMDSEVRTTRYPSGIGLGKTKVTRR